MLIVHGILKEYSTEEIRLIYRKTDADLRPKVEPAPEPENIPNIPKKLKSYLFEKYSEYVKNLKRNELISIPFTYGIDDDSGISAITVLHPNDDFNKSNGYKMIRGRILRMRGDLEWEDDEGILHQSPYDPIPDNIEVEKYV